MNEPTSIRDKSFDNLEITDRALFLRRCFKTIRFNEISGDYLEFGTYNGANFVMAHVESRRMGLTPLLWAFDSFSGLPAPTSDGDRHPQWREGNFSTDLASFLRTCQLFEVPSQDIRVVRGYFETTIGNAAPDDAKLPRDICLAYIDCDMYSSTVTVLEFLRPRLKHGMIVAFDDYYCWAKDQVAGERRAMLEFVRSESRFRFLPYIQFGNSGLSFMIEDRSLLPEDPLPWQL